MNVYDLGEAHSLPSPCSRSKSSAGVSSPPTQLQWPVLYYRPIIGIPGGECTGPRVTGHSEHHISVNGRKEANGKTCDAEF